MFRKVLKRIAAGFALLCAFAVVGIAGAIEGGAALDIVPGALGLAACGLVFTGLSYLI